MERQITKAWGMVMVGRQDKGRGKALHAGTGELKEGLTEKVASEQSPEGGKGRKLGVTGTRTFQREGTAGAKALTGSVHSV